MWRMLIIAVLGFSSRLALAEPGQRIDADLLVAGIPYIHVNQEECSLVPLTNGSSYIKTTTRDPTISLIGAFVVGSVRVGGVRAPLGNREVDVVFQLPFEPPGVDAAEYPFVRQDGRLERFPGLDIVGPLPWLMQALPNCRFEDVPPVALTSYLSGLSRFERSIQVVVLTTWRRSRVGPLSFRGSEDRDAMRECQNSRRCQAFSEWVVHGLGGSPAPVDVQL